MNALNAYQINVFQISRFMYKLNTYPNFFLIYLMK